MTTLVRYSIDVIQEEACQLIHQGVISPQQKIYRLAEYFPARQWEEIEKELELNNFLLRDPMIDLLPQEIWDNDE